jgi:hypothetical protein
MQAEAEAEEAEAAAMLEKLQAQAGFDPSKNGMVVYDTCARGPRVIALLARVFKTRNSVRKNTESKKSRAGKMKMGMCLKKEQSTW